MPQSFIESTPVIGSVALEFGTRSLASASPITSEDIKNELHDAYETLALRRHDEFVKTLSNDASEDLQNPTDDKLSTRKNAIIDLARSDTVKHGFMVCGRIIGLSLKAYRLYGQRFHNNLTPEGLKSILLHRQTIASCVIRLAKIDSTLSSVLEEQMCLLGDTYDFNRNSNLTPFTIEADNTGQPFMNIRQDILLAASNEVGTDSNRSNGQCPAIQFITPLYRNMVEEAATNSTLFPAEFLGNKQVE